MFKVSNKNTWTTSLTSFWCLYWKTLRIIFSALTQFHSTNLFLPTENIRKPEVFWCFQGVSNDTPMAWNKLIECFYLWISTSIPLLGSNRLVEVLKSLRQKKTIMQKKKKKSLTWYCEFLVCSIWPVNISKTTTQFKKITLGLIRVKSIAYDTDITILRFLYE